MHVDKSLFAPVTGTDTLELSCDVYYNPATLNTSSYYNWLNGRGNNTGFHSGMMLPGGINEAQFEGRWRLQDVGSVINKAGLTADWYRYSMIITATTFQIKLFNLRTNVLLEGNVRNIGTADNADAFNYTFFSYGISGNSGAYGTIGVNVSNIKITRGSSTLFHAPLSEGYLAIVRDVVSKTAYALGFFTISAGWAKLADYSHYNFKNGYTLYTKLANPNIYVPNDSTGAEIPWTPLLSYVKVANYKGTTSSYNQCESKFKLDDVAITPANITVAGAGSAVANGQYIPNGDLANDKPVYFNASANFYIYFQYYWRITDSNADVYYSDKYSQDLATPDLVTEWEKTGRSSDPAPTVTLVPASVPDIYTADVDHVLFTENTGIAKEIEIQDVYSDVVDLTLDRGHLYINSDSDKNLMLYKTDKGVDTPEDLKIWAYVEK